jgi:hypothetical protein
VSGIGEPAGAGLGLGKTFNNDLLVGPADQERARALFPALMPVLYNPALIALFQPHDEAANRAKRNGHRWGMVAVALATAALLLASANEIYHDWPKPWPKVIGGIAALAGIAGVFIALLGGLHTRAKHHWLLHRLMTERLRQFHFQFLVEHARAIAHAAARSEAMPGVIAARDAAFAAFNHRHEGQLPSEMPAIVADEADARAWVVAAAGTATPPAARGAKSAELRPLYDAYRLLRIDHQIGYADYQLRSASAFGFKSPRQQAQVLTFATFGAILLVFVLHILEAFGVAFGIPTFSGSGITLVATWLALVTLGVRALEEGLKPKREIERYRRYRAQLVALRARFEAAPDDDARFAAMRGVELAAYVEMREFLAVHEEAAFVL